ncbi:MAG: DNA translocase FtsK, partial [Candidatus Methylomirabilales bacterium]
PIPGKAVVGVEIPNQNRAVVSLRENLSSKEYEQKKAKTPLPIAVGKDIAGEPYVADLLQMPHLLIAGATGSGKSMCLHALILSILYRSTPKEVRFLLIDPKRVELSIYKGLPHLADAVIYEAKEAAKRLHRVVAHMEERYRIFAEAGARNLVAYNKSNPQTLPYLVVVIDELADLMHMAAAEVENAIARLAQMARAVGIHLIVATQRPSVDVITGVIKANFPARLSFQVSSKVDSRTILDQSGAEQLLGSGDMLFVPPQSAKPIRIHAPYVSEPEIQRVVEYLERQGGAEPFQWSLLPEEAKVASEEEPDDHLYRQAVEIVLQTRQASISLLQRRLRIGFNRAARLIERMEAEGIVSPMEGGRPREVLVSDEG